MASPEKQDGKKKTSSRAKKHSSLQKDSKSGGSGSKRPQSCITSPQKVGPEKQQTARNERCSSVTPKSKKADMENGTAKVSNKSACNRNKALQKLRGSYSLRSLDSSRVLRSDATKCTPMNLASNPENLVTKKKKRVKKKVKNPGQDELSRIEKHVKYMLKRMNYEQSLIDAYSGEGWKGQSAEKIRPEKELERAKSEILRCKLKIREIFQHLDSLLAEGRLQESLFDPDGIDSEKIFCGKCGSEEVSADNDIILCDGDCERGFHQKCLNPPLLSENVPTGDEGWLCPQCDCKVECIDLLNESRGTDLSIEDSWESIFPEAAALTNGNRLYDDLNLPSDDSEDDDYDPDAQVVAVVEQEDGSGYEESDSSSSSYDSTSSDDNVNEVTVELPTDDNVNEVTAESPTDDSEDDDYDPDVADPDKEIHKSKSSSDESDFTSDSDEFCTELSKISCVDEASASSLPNLDIFVDFGRDDSKLKDKHLNNSELPSAMRDVDQHESVLRSSHKRDRERLDYKKLYDEAYGKLTSDSSDDEEWIEMSKPKKKKTDDKGAEEVTDDTFAKTTQKLRKKSSGSSAAENEPVPQEPRSSGCSFATVQGISGLATKKLYEAFQENQFPTREMKESLAQELGMTVQKVTKWFGTARRRESNNFEKATSEASIQCETPTDHSDPDKLVETTVPVASTPHKATDAIKTTRYGQLDKKKLEAAFEEIQYPSKEKKEELAQELGITVQKVTKRFGTARRWESNNFEKATSEASIQPETPADHSDPDKLAETKVPVARTPHNSSTARYGQLDKKKLEAAFEESQYPSREKKEELAQELGITVLKVSRWFDNARRPPRRSRVSVKTSSPDNAEEKRPVAFTPDKSATSARNAKPENRVVDEVLVKGSPIDRVPHVIDLESGEVSIANGASSNKKAIAKELRRLRTG